MADVRYPLTAAQVADMVGPDNPGCDCLACKEVATVRRLICDTITAHDMDSQTRYAGTEDADYQPAAWLTVLLIAAARASAQGFSTGHLIEVVASGATSAHDLNPLLGGRQETMQ